MGGCCSAWCVARRVGLGRPVRAAFGRSRPGLLSETGPACFGRQSGAGDSPARGPGPGRQRGRRARWCGPQAQPRTRRALEPTTPSGGGACPLTDGTRDAWRHLASCKGVAWPPSGHASVSPGARPPRAGSPPHLCSTGIALARLPRKRARRPWACVRDRHPYGRRRAPPARLRGRPDPGRTGLEPGPAQGRR